MKNLSFCTLFLCAFLLQSIAQDKPAQIKIELDDRVNPWNHLKVNNAPERFQFAIVTDRTGGLRPGVFKSAIPKLNLLQPEFVMSVGDLISGYTDDEDVIDKEWDEFDSFIEQLKMPFFYVPGNHDYINDVMAEKWKERLGKDYYHFTYQDVLFMCLNTEELKRGAGRGYIDDPQYEYIKKTLEENKEAKWTLIFMHQPLWDQDDSGRWEDVEKLLADRKHTVFVGHRHRYVKYERNNGKYFILATTGGGSGLRGPRFGEFDHVVWVTMTDDGPILANLMLDGIWDENVNTEEFYSFSRPLINNPAYQISPIFAENGGFNGGKLKIKLQNDSDVPMESMLSFSSNKDLWAVSSDIQKTISPNSVEIIEVPIETRNGQSLSSTDPISLHLTNTYRAEGKADLVLTSTEKFAPVFTQTIPKLSKEIKIDGMREDWEKLRFMSDENSYSESNPITHKGNEDCQLSFDLTYDDKYLYVYAEVQDDKIEAGNGASTFDQDGVFVLVDARPKEESIVGKGGRAFWNFLLLGASPTEGESLYHWKDRYPTDTKIKCVKSEGKYSLEAAIPVEYLDAKAGGSWQDLRINVIAADSDFSGEHLTQIYWQPDWRSKANVMGAGMFKKE